ncbi:hypothetical protein R3W88_014909 [Solanum pinnatisectum]|uniref:Uncharacterized protein n=1 Tax=Solanum pinnatisectum TaxID=50273 RepID=A0AAV9KTF4_9SOLN|nr:hypothetical protein R3W88_014909 [Solanum pinnatisectum]
MKRKTVLSITIDGSLKVKRSTIVFTNQFHGETKKEEDEAITVFVGSQMEDSNLTQSSYHITVEEDEDWIKPLIEYLEHGRLLEDPRVRADIKRRTPQFIFYDGILFRRSYEGLFLWCLDKEEAQQTMEEAHSGTCGAH